MSDGDPAPIRIHEDSAMFMEAVSFTAASTGFTPRLIEKDYFCSIILQYLTSRSESQLVFKGGTYLAKVHVDFYRLSEDLDFVIPISTDAGRQERRSRAADLKETVALLPERVPGLMLQQPLSGFNESRQYLGTIGYPSQITGRHDSIKIEIGLREPLLRMSRELPARTALRDPISDELLLPPLSIRSIDLKEAMAEKIRAAATRREPAIRDYFDLDYAVERKLVRLDDNELVDLVR